MKLKFDIWQGVQDTEDEEDSVPINQIIVLITGQQMIEMEKIRVPTPSADLVGRLFDFYLGPQQEELRAGEEEGAEENMSFLM